MAGGVATTVSFGGLFGRSFRTFFSRIPQYLGIALILGVPCYLLIFALMALLGLDIVADPARGEVTPAQGIAAAAVALIGLLAYLLITAGTVNAAIQQLRGFEVSVGQSLRMALARIGPVLLVSLLLYAILIGVIVVAAVLAMIPFIGFVFGIAAVGLVVYLYVYWWVVVPTVVVENPGVVASLKRSAALTRGHRWLILGFLFVFGLVVGAGVGALSVVVTLPFALAGLEIVGNLLSALVGLGAYSLFAVAAAVAYHDLRVEKEGADGNRLATVFD